MKSSTGNQVPQMFGGGWRLVQASLGVVQASLGVVQASLGVVQASMGVVQASLRVVQSSAVLSSQRLIHLLVARTALIHGYTL